MARMTSSALPWLPVSTLTAWLAGRSSETGPCTMTRPRLRMTARLQTSSTSWSRCDDRKTVMPSLPSWRMSSRTSFMPCGSRPLVGSSSTMTSGLWMSARAMPRRCRMPWEKPPALESARSSSPTMSSTSAMRSSLTSPFILAEHAQVAPGRHVAVEHGVVHEAAQMAQSPLPVGRDLVVEHLRVAAGGVDEPEDHADGGGLAAAVGAEEPEHVALADGDAQVVDGAQLLEVFGQPVGGQHHRAAFAVVQALFVAVVELLSSH